MSKLFTATLSCGYFSKYSHLAIPARLYCLKGDQINESLLYSWSFINDLLFN